LKPGADRREKLTSSGGPFGDRAAVAIVGDSLGDVAREALKIARAESQSRPVLLVDLLGDGSALDEMFHDDDLHGVSDGARYGMSLATLARPVPNVDSLFVVTGGVESPLADDVLTDHMWGSWSDQCRKAGALLVVAAPADLPQVGKTIDQLDGVLMIGDGVAPRTQAPVLGRVKTNPRGVPAIADAARAAGASVAAVPAIAPPSAEEALDAVREKPDLIKRIRFVAIAAFAILAGLAGTWLWNGALEPRVTANPNAVGQRIVLPGDPEPGAPVDSRAVAVGSVPWTVEVVSLNTRGGALARVRQTLDSFPVPTFAATQPGGGSAIWYRFLAGAFATSAEADWYLTALRERGILGPAAGRVMWAPLAWQLEDGVPEDELDVRLFGWRQRGLPAYALIDEAGTTRIYFGAFENEAEARLLSPMIDSLNLNATLATRIGSVR
jgi:hypothetical protein